MFKKFYPCHYMDSVFSIDYDKIYTMGYKAIIFDIDNTLVPHGDDSTQEIDDLFSKIQKIGIKTFLLSNNSEERVKKFLSTIDCLYICEAQKPSDINYLKAVKIMKVKKEESLFIGDQIFTDILGANKSGIDSILVKFIQEPGETKIGKRRHLENIILKIYKKNKFLYNRLGDIYKERDC